MNEALQVLEERGFIKQCSNLDGLDRLMSSEPVSFYVGIDPTGASMHIGHLVPLYAMAHMAKAGHQAVALVGGGTARIGDPTDRDEIRRIMTIDEINANVCSMRAQIERFLATAGAQPIVVNNADWLAELKYIEFLRDIGRHFSVNRMLTFETYRKRMESGLSFIEFNYQLLQSYDFLNLFREHGVRLQIGGDDQWGNIIAGVDLIRRVESAEAFCLTFPLVTRADGKKMGKTESGAVFLDPDMCSPFEMYQYWRNVPDADVGKFLLTFTFLPVVECRRLGGLKDAEINEAKDVLAYQATMLIHGRDVADAARLSARSAFGTESVPGDLNAIPEVSVPGSQISGGITVVDLFARTELCSSKSEARRLVQQGGATINDVKITDPDQIVGPDMVRDSSLLLRAGKKRYFRVVVESALL